MLRRTLITALCLFCIIGLFTFPLRGEEVVKASDTSSSGETAKDGKEKIAILEEAPQLIHMNRRHHPGDRSFYSGDKVPSRFH
jgi:hypothetical protein